MLESVLSGGAKPELAVYRDHHESPCLLDIYDKGRLGPSTAHMLPQYLAAAELALLLRAHQ